MRSIADMAPSRTVAWGGTIRLILNPIRKLFLLSDLKVELECDKYHSLLRREQTSYPHCQNGFSSPRPKILYMMELRGKMLPALKAGRTEVITWTCRQHLPDLSMNTGLATGFGQFCLSFRILAIMACCKPQPYRKTGHAPLHFAFGDSIKSTLQMVVTRMRKRINPCTCLWKERSRELVRIDNCHRYRWHAGADF